MTTEYEYGKAYPLTDGWEQGARFDAGDGVRRYVRVVDKAEHDEHRSDGHRADGSPYWNYVRVQRAKAPKWELAPASPTPPADVTEAEVEAAGFELFGTALYAKFIPHERIRAALEAAARVRLTQ